MAELLLPRGPGVVVGLILSTPDSIQQIAPVEEQWLLCYVSIAQQELCYALPIQDQTMW